MNGLLICPPLKWQKGKNIGDYIQSLAQEQYWDKIDCYVYRDWMKSFKSDEKVNLIMNGWFMWDTEEFPPSESINPFFISFHLTPKAAKKILNRPEAIDYLKKYAPIGCRDKDTQKLLRGKGIDAYFSGCLTTTLGLNYHQLPKTDSVLFIEPFNPLSIKKLIPFLVRSVKSLYYYFENREKVIKLSKKAVFEKKTPIGWVAPRLAQLLNTAMFYHEYSKLFSDELLMNATYISQIIPIKGISEEEKLSMAKDYLSRYARAPMVITSRLHAAFPSMAIGTQTLYINADVFFDDSYRPAGRLEGNLELLNYYTWTKHGFVPNPDNQLIMNGDKINMNTIIKTPQKFIDVSNELINRTKRFVRECYENKN